ncbi:hypothetical protein [Priestia megaterium]|uniref:hypothetical protein n=1 Tax=Priestia megaterium TaxID=1404 RepID=UPI00149466E8|nr:hypothetical protein [Priestia megaterium]
MNFGKDSNKNQRVIESALIQYIRGEENPENIKDALDLLDAFANSGDDESESTT